MKRMRDMKPLWMLSIALIVSILACSKDSSTGPGPTPVEKDYLALGWSNFESQKYDSAVTTFTTAYNQATTAAARGEALDGRGWAYTYKRDLSKGKADFVFATSVTEVTQTVLNDVHVGGAIAMYSLNDFSSSAAYASAALTSNPSYLFTHDAKVTAKRVRILLAQSYYAAGQFFDCAAQLDILDAAHAPHAVDPPLLLAGISSLLNLL
jgi:tetratricopeptide (TPR) repeat protein